MGAGTTDWAASETVVTTAGTYKFVFISGTYDYTHGTLSGASLYIDDVDVETANGPEVVVEYINVLDVESARTAIDVLNTANEQVATARAYVGALTNRVQSAINVLTTRKNEQEKAAGRIADADYARESARLAKMQILNQASNKMLAEANNMKNVLKLI
jgi:flagellin-like hook-associated protein FlgL